MGIFYLQQKPSRNYLQFSKQHNNICCVFFRSPNPGQPLEKNKLKKKYIYFYKETKREKQKGGSVKEKRVSRPNKSIYGDGGDGRGCECCPACCNKVCGTLCHHQTQKKRGKKKKSP